MKEKETQLNKIEQIKPIVDQVLAEFMDMVEYHLDENGEVDFGGGEGYRSKDELLEDFLVFVQTAHLDHVAIIRL